MYPLTLFFDAFEIIYLFYSIEEVEYFFIYVRNFMYTILMYDCLTNSSSLGVKHCTKKFRSTLSHINQPIDLDLFHIMFDTSLIPKSYYKMKMESYY